MSAETRPDIATITTGAELRRWYWLKAELAAHARTLGLRTTGGKFTLLDRIAHYLDTGETTLPGDTAPRPTSTFPWATATLTTETVITDNYRNGPNVRRFFQEHADSAFTFSTPFMAWMKANTGRTLADAIVAYHALKAEAAKPGHRSRIARHNQFNQYTRDFLADNPDRGMADVRHFWALKRQRPSEDGRHRYDPSDLDLE